MCVLLDYKVVAKKEKSSADELTIVWRLKTNIGLQICYYYQ